MKNLFIVFVLYFVYVKIFKFQIEEFDFFLHKFVCESPNIVLLSQSKIWLSTFVSVHFVLVVFLPKKKLSCLT